MRVVAALLIWLLAVPALAQGTADPDLGASLVADRVFLNGDSTLTAEGAVEVVYRSVRMTASRIVYDATTEVLTIEGPIKLDDGVGTVILADQAELSRDLQDGIMTSARVVMRDQLQLAANELSRVGGRYMQLTRVVASSCQVCATNPTPLWELRASRVIHDEVRQRLYFDNAQLRLAGIPVLFVPRLRLPGPGIDRATGFLAPKFRTDSQLGPGVLLPYFIVLGDSRDLTLTPYLANSRTTTLNFRYRQMFRRGDILVEGAVSDDTIRPGEMRGYFFANGAFILPRDYRLTFAVKTASDASYLLDYDVSSQDRLASFVAVNRSKRDQSAEFRITRYKSIRVSENSASLPTPVADFSIVRRHDMPGIGGVADLSFGLHTHQRSSTVALDLNGDGTADGRDVQRLSATIGWQRILRLPAGMLGSVNAEVGLDSYGIGDDAGFPSRVVRTFPTAAVELRWPWVKSQGDGASQVIEPIAQVVWSPDSAKAVPNEDSRLVEFDEANLFALDRFPGEDAVENGLRANLGVSWTRYDPRGWSIGVTAGRVIRERDLGQFTAGTGLAGKRSDWLVATHFQNTEGLEVANRALFDDDLNFTQNELRLTYSRRRLDVSGGFIWQVADPAQSRAVATRELTLATGWDFAEGWRGTAATRYDFVAGRPATAALGVAFANECAVVDVSLSRRFTSSTSVRPVTDFNLEVTLNGFGSGSKQRSFRQSCRG